jgi:hypothetical protein
MLVSSLAGAMIENLVFTTGSDHIRYFYGPFPHTICLLRTTIVSSLLLQILLLVTVMVITKFVFIFYLKNPTALDDKFWILFLNMWIAKFAFISQIVATLLPGKNNYSKRNFYGLLSELVSYSIPVLP